VVVGYPEETVALEALASWTHLLATVILVGYYLVLALVVLPVLTRGPAWPVVLSAIERRAMPLLVGALVVFFATGVYMLGSEAFADAVGGGESWSTLLLVKHLLVVGMLVVGSLVDGLIVRAAADGVDLQRSAREITVGVVALAALGVLVLLLTAAAQLA
jgi:uncharacterized membrane protein